MKFETRNYQESLLVAANIYLLVALVLKLYTQKEIAEYFPEKSGYLFNDSLFFNQVFKEFLEKNLGVSLSELLPYIQHSARFYCFIEKVVLQSGGLELADSSQDQTVSKLLFPSSTKGNRPKSSSTSKPVTNKNNRAVGDHTGPGNHQKDSHGAGVGKRPKSNQKQQVVDLVDKSSTKLSEVATPQRKRRSGKSKGSHPRTGSDKHCHDAQLLRTMLEHPEKSSMTKLG